MTNQVTLKKPIALATHSYKIFVFSYGKMISKCILLRRNENFKFQAFNKTSRAGTAKLRPFGTGKKCVLINKNKCFGSIQDLKIDAQTRVSGVRVNSCDTAQTEKFWVLLIINC